MNQNPVRSALDSCVPPPTEGIKYLGSKRTLIGPLLQIIADLDVRSVLDGFSGTTRVSQALAHGGYQVYANDIADWSRVFATCYLLNEQPAAYYRPMIDHLNHLPGQDGWFTETYGGLAQDGNSTQSDGKKRVWQVHNTRKLDAIRDEIDRLTTDPTERSVLLSSLMLAMDKVDNTVGHQAAYLRCWAGRSYREMQMVIPNLIPRQRPHRVFQDDIFNVVDKIQADLAYFDPPYGSANEKMPPSRVRYAAYYHLWTTVCRNDRPPVVGAANRRSDASDTESASVFEEFRRGPSGRFLVTDAVETLLSLAKSRFVLLSYSNQGRLTLDEILAVFQNNHWQFRAFQFDYRSNVMETMRWTNQWTDPDRKPTREYLFLLSR